MIKNKKSYPFYLKNEREKTKKYIYESYGFIILLLLEGQIDCKFTSWNVRALYSYILWASNIDTVCIRAILRGDYFDLRDQCTMAFGDNNVLFLAVEMGQFFKHHAWTLIKFQCLSIANNTDHQVLLLLLQKDVF